MKAVSWSVSWWMMLNSPVFVSPSRRNARSHWPERSMRVSSSVSPSMMSIEKPGFSCRKRMMRSVMRYWLITGMEPMRMLPCSALSAPEMAAS